MLRAVKDTTVKTLRWNKRQALSFFSGFALPFRGLAHLLRHPSLLLWAIPPALITTGLILGGFALTLGYTDDLLNLVWTQPSADAWYVTWLLLPLWYLLFTLVALVLSLLSVLLAYLISIPIAGPFNERLSEKVEHIETGFEAPFDWGVLLRNIAVSLLHVGLFTLIQLTIFALLSAIGLVPVVGQIVAIILSAITSPLLAGFAPFDFPMTIRLWGFGEKMEFMLRNFPMFYGFSLASFLLLYIPGVNIVLMPCCVVGATLAILRLEQQGGLPLPDRRKDLLRKRGLLHDAPKPEPEPEPEEAPHTEAAR